MVCEGCGKGQWALIPQKTSYPLLEILAAQPQLDPRSACILEACLGTGAEMLHMWYGVSRLLNHQLLVVAATQYCHALPLSFHDPE